MYLEGETKKNLECSMMLKQPNIDYQVLSCSETCD